MGERRRAANDGALSLGVPHEDAVLAAHLHDQEWAEKKAESVVEIHARHKRLATRKAATDKTRARARTLSKPAAIWLVYTWFHASEKQLRCEWGTNSLCADVGAARPCELAGVQS